MAPPGRRRPAVGARRAGGRGADRGGDLHRFRHPGFPRAAGPVDHEPGRREAVHLPGLRQRSRGAPPVLAGAPRPPGLARRAQPCPRGAGGPGQVRAGHLGDHAEHRRAAPEGGHARGPGDRAARNHVQRGVRVLRRPVPDGRRPGPGRGRGRGPAVHQVRGDPEIGDRHVRPAAGSGRVRAGRAGGGHVRGVPGGGQHADRGAGRLAVRGRRRGGRARWSSSTATPPPTTRWRPRSSATRSGRPSRGSPASCAGPRAAASAAGRWPAAPPRAGLCGSPALIQAPAQPGPGGRAVTRPAGPRCAARAGG